MTRKCLVSVFMKIYGLGPEKKLSGPLFWPDMSQLWAMCGSKIYFNFAITSSMTRRCLVSVFMMIYGFGPEKNSPAHFSGQTWAMCVSKIYFNVEIPSGMTRRCLASVFMMIYGLGPEKTSPAHFSGRTWASYGPCVGPKYILTLKYHQA